MEGAPVLCTAYLDGFAGRLVTTEWVLMELADALSAPTARSTAVAFLRAVRADALFEVIGYDQAVYRAGFDLFAARPDKGLVPNGLRLLRVSDRARSVRRSDGGSPFRAGWFSRCLQIARIWDKESAPCEKLLPRLRVSRYIFSSTSARCSARTLLPRRRRHPAMFIRQPASVATTMSAPVFSMKAALSCTIAPLIPGKRTEKDPPKPQHSSLRSKGTYSKSLTLRKSRSGSACRPRPRRWRAMREVALPF